MNCLKTGINVTIYLLKKINDITIINMYNIILNL